MSTESRTWKEDNKNQDKDKARLMLAGQICSNWMLFLKRHTITRFFNSAFNWLS